MAKILVTGAAGYVGSILTPRLLAAGHSVVALDNFMFRQASLLDCCSHPDFQMVRGDARDKDLLRQCLAGVDVIAPLACLTGAPLCQSDPVGATTTIRNAVRDLLALRSPRQAVIYPATGSGYGACPHGQPCTEETPLRPGSLYSRLKVQAEQEILAAGNAITLRLATAFGASPRMRTDLLVNDFVLRAVRDRCVVLFEAGFKRSFIHVRDVAEAFVHCLANFGRMKDQAYNVGLEGVSLSKREVCREIAQVVSGLHVTEHATGHDPDRRDYVVSNAKIAATGFVARRTLQEGIVELVKAYHILPMSPFGNA